MTWIQTNSIKKFDILNPRPEMVDINDIANSLSHLCRYNGHSNKMYTVAHHSVLVAKTLELMGESPEVVFWGLCHDFSEAYCGDMPYPLKSHPSMAPFREAEARIVAAICEKFKIKGDEPDIVKAVDRGMVAYEREHKVVYDSLHKDWGIIKIPYGMDEAISKMDDFEKIINMSINEIKSMLISEFWRLIVVEGKEK